MTCSRCSASSLRRWLLPEPWRLFVAAPLPSAAGAAIFGALEPLRSDFPDVRWLTPEKLHLTLVFLGQTDAQRVAIIAAGLDEVARRHRVYEAASGAAGGRIDERPTVRRGGVAWLTLGAGGAETSNMALDVDAQLAAATYGEQRRPRPHLTVARKVDRRALDALSDVAARLDVRWAVERIVLFRSHTGPGGSRYEELAASELEPAV